MQLGLNDIMTSHLILKMAASIDAVLRFANPNSFLIRLVLIKFASNKSGLLRTFISDKIFINVVFPFKHNASY